MEYLHVEHEKFDSVQFTALKNYFMSKVYWQDPSTLDGMKLRKRVFQSRLAPYPKYILSIPPLLRIISLYFSLCFSFKVINDLID